MICMQLFMNELKSARHVGVAGGGGGGSVQPAPDSDIYDYDNDGWSHQIAQQ